LNHGRPPAPGKIRVVHIITKLELGGAQQNTLYTLGHLDPGRYSGLLVTHPEGLLVADALADGRYDRRFVRSLVREVRPVRDAVALAALVGILRREMREARGRCGDATPPVIVHTHSSKAGILGRAAARIARVPVVIHTVHGFGFHPRQRQGVRRLYIALERLAARWTSHVIAVAQADLDEGVALGIFARERVSLIRSGIEIARCTGAGVDRETAVRSLGFDPARPLVGMVACLKPQKNPVDFVRAAALVAGSVPDAQFLLAGDGVLRPAVEEEIRRSGLDGRFRLLGWRRDVETIIPCLDVLVLTSLWEGLPRVFPQAMAAGRPIVAYRVDSAPEAVTEGVTGYLVAPGDYAGAAARITRLLVDPERVRRMGEAGRERVAEFDADLMVRKQEELYSRLWREVTARVSPPGLRSAAG
jgi:glycosyltransferase involved in cell wall biosynthesis